MKKENNFNELNLLLKNEKQKKESIKKKCQLELEQMDDKVIDEVIDKLKNIRQSIIDFTFSKEVQQRFTEFSDEKQIRSFSLISPPFEKNKYFGSFSIEEDNGKWGVNKEDYNWGINEEDYNYYLSEDTNCNSIINKYIPINEKEIRECKRVLFNNLKFLKQVDKVIKKQPEKIKDYVYYVKPFNF